MLSFLPTANCQLASGDSSWRRAFAINPGQEPTLYLPEHLRRQLVTYKEDLLKFLFDKYSFAAHKENELI